MLPAETRQDWHQKNLLVLSGQTIYESGSAEIGGTTLQLETTIAPIFVDQRVTGLVGINIDVTERKRAEEKIKNSYNQLSVQREIDQIILGGSDIRSMLGGIARHAASLLRMDAVEILLYDPDTLTLEIMARCGVQAYSTFKPFPVSGDIASRAVLQQQTIFERDFGNYLNAHPNCEQLRLENFCEYFAVPLIAKGSVRGVIEFFHCTDFQPDGDWWQLAHTLAGQAAIAIDNMSMFLGLQRSNSEISLAYDLTLVGWSKALEVRDQETEGHSQRVADLTIRLAEALGVPRSQIIHIRRGALLHDIGKMGIPDEILHKPGKLSEDEWAIVKKHPRTAFDLLLPIPFLRPALDIPYCHHERWDGSGYPRGLKGESIPLAARIFSIVDVWDALTSDRPYRSAIPFAKARCYLREQSAILFDPQIVTVFEQLVRDD